MRHEREHARHLHDVEDGVGCTEIWEHLSDRRTEADESTHEEGNP
ncbi:hypothetical protein V5735_21045 (plasmid) [Haladaptatus sp. SPP-AMP-3]